MCLSWTHIYSEGEESVDKHFDVPVYQLLNGLLAFLQMISLYKDPRGERIFGLHGSGPKSESNKTAVTGISKK